MHDARTPGPLFKTERFLLRELVPDDAEAMYRLNADPQVVRYTGDGAWPSVEASRRFLENYPDYREHGMGRWAVIGKADGLFYGWCGLKRLPEGVDVGYRFFRAYWGRGVATETARASVAYGFGPLALDRLIAKAAVDNAASIRVLEKLGMRRAGETRLGELPAITFDLARSEWHGARSGTRS